MLFSTFLNTNLSDQNITPKVKIKNDFEHYKQLLNWSGKSEMIYNNLIDNILWILETKYGKFNLRYTDNVVSYNELNIILSQQLPQWLFIQKKQALENLETFASLNNWGSVVKDRVYRNINGNESVDNSVSFVPIDSPSADPYEKSGVSRNLSNQDNTEEDKQTVDYLYWFSRMKWQTASIELNTILKPYLGLFILMGNADLAVPIKEDQFETLQSQIVNTNDRIDQVVTAVDGEIERVDSKIDREVRRVDRDISSIRTEIANQDLDNVARRNTENTFTNQNVFEQRVFFNGEVITQSVELEQPPTNPNHAIPLGTAEALVNEAKDEINHSIDIVSNNTLQNSTNIEEVQRNVFTNSSLIARHENAINDIPKVKTMIVNLSQMSLRASYNINGARFQNYNYQISINHSRVVAMVPIMNGGTTPDLVICAPKIFTNNYIELPFLLMNSNGRPFNVGGHIRILYI